MDAFRWKGVVPLQITIFLLFLAVLAALTGVIVWYNYQSNAEAALVQAEVLLTEVSGKVIERAQLINEPLYALGRMSPYLESLADKPDLGPHPATALLTRSLEVHPQISAVYMGYGDGDTYIIFSLPPGDERKRVALAAPEGARFAIFRLIRDRAGKAVGLWRYLNGDRVTVGSRVERDPDFDPRTRVWFRNARESEGLVRSPLYYFAYVNELGYTLSQRFDGPIPGVFGADVTLGSMSRFLAAQSFSANSKVVMFTEGGILTGHPDADLVASGIRRRGSGEVMPLHLNQIGDPALKALYMAVKTNPAREPRTLRLHTDEGEYLARVAPLPQAFDRPEYMAALVPVDEILGPIARNGRNAALVSLVLFVLSVPIILWMSRRVSRPIEALIGETETIQRFDLANPVVVRSRIKEIRALAQSLDTMKTSLRSFGRFVPRAMVRRIVQSGLAPELGGERRELTLFFSDIAGFTDFSETLDPEVLTRRISDYFQAVGAVLEECGGTIDKYIGDAVMAFWNAPTADQEHARRACFAALEVTFVVARLNATLEEEGETPMVTRIGLHTGEAVVGYVGSVDRMDYTAMGAAVNLASRLEGLNKIYGTRILISQDTLDRAGEGFVTRPLDLVRPKGVSRPTRVHALIGLSDPRAGVGGDPLMADAESLALIADWREARVPFDGQDWARAVPALETFLAAHPGDRPGALLLERAQVFLDKPPSHDWDGVLDVTTK
ncbi:MAG: HAMP domain-containing protein [Rhodospirillum sp.]|nr:HAMP domain-containing protein [Rhodospirillum sp.]MCF8488222.1 HAMP domain-containing protein [Rhodospirillum sp.]MCF8502519.1 HAMP domain-containing protein [Rhodospirillum sp.]